jgi:hypothetical protein
MPHRITRAVFGLALTLSLSTPVLAFSGAPSSPQNSIPGLIGTQAVVVPIINADFSTRNGDTVVCWDDWECWAAAAAAEIAWDNWRDADYQQSYLNEVWLVCVQTQGEYDPDCIAAYEEFQDYQNSVFYPAQVELFAAVLTATILCEQWNCGDPDTDDDSLLASADWVIATRRLESI